MKPAAALAFVTTILLSHGQAGQSTPATASQPLSFWDGKLTFDLEERIRIEVRDENFDFDDRTNSPTDDGWLLQRFRIGVKITPLSWLALNAQAQDSREWDSARPNHPGVMGAEGDDAVDLRQAYLEIGDPSAFPVIAKIGRQVLAYGDERLVGSLEWSNLGRTFDAVKIRIHSARWWAELFAASVVVPVRGEFNQSDLFNGLESHRDQIFSGLYLSTSAISFQTTDLYGFYLHENAPANTRSTGTDSNVWTVGTRIKADPAQLRGFDYDVEVAAQFGKVAGLDLRAFAAHAGLGYQSSLPGKPRIYAEYNYASGDHDPSDGESTTFMNLFPTNHKFYGFMDAFAWQNLHNTALSLRASPFQNVAVQLDGHLFWLADDRDAWYRANGMSRVRPIAPGYGRYCGAELDFTLTWKPIRQLTLSAGYSRFFAGHLLDATGRSADADFFYTQAEMKF